MQLIEIADQRGAVPLPDRGFAPAVKARHPHLIAPQEMAERAVDGTPECPAIAPSLRVGKPLRGRVDAPVHLGVIARHGLNEGGVHENVGWKLRHETSASQKRSKRTGYFVGGTIRIC